MADTHCPDPGAIVTYLNPDVSDPVAFVLGVVSGAHVVDPQTKRTWVPVLRPDCSTFVLDAANIVEVLPSDDRADHGPQT